VNGATQKSEQPEVAEGPPATVFRIAYSLNIDILFAYIILLTNGFLKLKKNLLYNRAFIRKNNDLRNKMIT